MKTKTQTLVSIGRTLCLSSIMIGLFIYAYHFLELTYLKAMTLIPYAYFLICLFDSMCQQEDRIKNGTQGYNPVEEFGVVLATTIICIVFL